MTYTKYKNVSDMLLLSAVALGLFTSTIFDKYDILYGREGLDYYAEVHKSKFNSWIHTFFMLGTVYGFSCSVPALFPINGQFRNLMQRFVWIWYLSHYTTIDIGTTIGVFFAYVVPASKAFDRVTQNQSRLKLFLHGILWSVVCLGIQETFGHYIGGDDPSRPEGVWNAIVYAPMYSVWHIGK